MAPIQPHSNTIPARTCENCHTTPKTIGYGMGNSRSKLAMNKDEPNKVDIPLFTNMADGYYGDIPGSKTARWQVPRITDFPYSLDQLITRSGVQTQNMPHLKDRPLDLAERSKMEREGLCVACHQHYSDKKKWDKIRDKVRAMLKDDKMEGVDPDIARKAAKEGRALAPELHDKIVESALKALIGELDGGSDEQQGSDPNKRSGQQQ